MLTSAGACLCFCAGLVCAPGAYGQQSESRDQPATTRADEGGDDQSTDDADTPAAEKYTDAAGALNLDALLGIEREADGADTNGEPADQDAITDQAGADPDEARLERELTAQQAADKFQQAVEQMGEAADLLRDAGDAGLTTQRLQQDILDKLEVLIEWSQNQQNQGGSSSSGGQQNPSGQQGGQQTPNDARTRGEQQQQGAEQQGQAGANDGEGTPPPFRERLGEVIDPSSPEWGQLPERVRESLLEGAAERFSAMYQRLTESYYRRLAEEASGE